MASVWCQDSKIKKVNIMDAFRSLKVAVGIMMSISFYFSACMQLACYVFSQHELLSTAKPPLPLFT